MMENERRLSIRKAPEYLAYIGLPSNNGGIVLDVSEGGVGFQAIAPVQADGPIQFRFAIDSSTRINAVGELVWKDATGKNGGLRFTELPVEIREQIRAWSGQSKALAVTKAMVPDIPPAGPEMEATALSSKIAFAPVAEISGADLANEIALALNGRTPPESAANITVAAPAVEPEIAAAPSAEPTTPDNPPANLAIVKPEIETGLSPVISADAARDAARNHPLLYNLKAPVYSAPSYNLSMFPEKWSLWSEPIAPAPRQPAPIRHPLTAIALTTIMAFLTAVGIFNYVSTTLTGQFLLYLGEEMLRSHLTQPPPQEHASPADPAQAYLKTMQP